MIGIKMEMPKGCNECRFFMYTGAECIEPKRYLNPRCFAREQWSLGEYVIENERPAECPLRTLKDEDDLTGEWIEDDYGYYHCSECGFEDDEPEYGTPFCPNCGAHMEDDEE